MAERRRKYHHGNLRQALVEATLALIVEKGPQGFTIAEAARAAGVSPAAPYRHFKSKEDVIAEAARQGYLIFAEHLEAAYRGGRPSGLSAMVRIGQAYLDFAVDYPGHYIAMFESSLSLAGNADLADASNRALAVMTRAAEKMTAHLPEAQRPPASMVSHHLWALNHGVVELFARASPGTRAPFSAEDLLETGTGIYLRGLGLIPPE